MLLLKYMYTGAVLDYDKYAKLIEKEGRDRNYAEIYNATADVSVDASTKDDHIAVKESTFATVVTSTYAPSDHIIPVKLALNLNTIVTDNTFINFFSTSIPDFDVPVVYLVLVTLPFDICLSLPILDMSTSSARVGYLVYTISLFIQA